MSDPRDMSDDELRAARAVWEADRAARWARVSALSGAAYMAAYDDYMAAKGRADAVAAEARRRGVRKRSAATAVARRRTPSPDFRFNVSTDATGVTAVADGAVRFPDPERVALRDALRGAVAQIDVRDGQVLRGVFAGPLPPHSKTDVENRLLLNIALREECLRRGFAFEHRRQSPPGWTCGYRYEAVDAEDPFDLWRPGRLLAAWKGIPLTYGLTAAAIWWALRTTRKSGADGPATATPATVLRAFVTSPAPLSLNQIKAVADGVVAATQWTRQVNPSGLDRLTTNLTRAGISAEPDAVAALLKDAAGAGGGHCKDGLIAKDGRMDPDDHLVVAGLVHVKPNAASATTVTASLHHAESASTSRPGG